MQALVGVGCNIHHIAEALRVQTEYLDQCKRVHKKGTDRCNISIMGLWLSGNHMKNGEPYTIHEEDKYQCPSWWNLVWAVCRRPGGANPARAKIIAKQCATGGVLQFQLCAVIAYVIHNYFNEKLKCKPLAQFD